MERLLSLKKLSDRSKEQVLNSLRLFLVYSHQSPDALVREAKRRPGAFEKRLRDEAAQEDRPFLVGAQDIPADGGLLAKGGRRPLDVE